MRAGATLPSAWGVALLAAVGVSLASSSLVDFSKVPDPSIQPRSQAFGIWAVIYSLIVASAWRADTEAFPREAAAWTVGSLLATAAWSAVVRQAWNPPSVVLIAGSAVAAWVAATLTPAPEMALSTGWLASGGVGLLAGWLTAASCVNLAIADPKFDSPYLLLAASIVGSIAGVTLRRPFPCIGVAWALLLQKEASPSTVGGSVLAALAAGIAAWRLREA